MYERYIFCISTGRAGSGYLTKLLEHTRECESVHEAYPNFAGDPIRVFNTSNEQDTLALQRIKTEYIKKRIPIKPVYAELNHTFIKSWYMAALEDFENVSVIRLRRNKQDIVESLLRLGTAPDISLAGRNWYLQTNFPTNLIQYQGTSTPRDICEWYVDEIDARAEKFIVDNPAIPVYEVWLEDLNTVDSVVDLLKKLELTPLDSLYEVIGKALNEKPRRNPRFLFRFFRHLRGILFKLKPARDRNRIHVNGDGYYD